MSDKYAYTFYGDGTTTWIYRYDRGGNIVRAKLTDDHYSNFDLAELPDRVAHEFRDVSKRKWSPKPVFEHRPATWELPINNNDTGISDEEFISRFLSRHRNTIFKDGNFWMLVENQDRNKSYIKVPYSMLRAFARKNRYFGNAIWMVE